MASHSRPNPGRPSSSKSTRQKRWTKTITSRSSTIADGARDVYSPQSYHTRSLSALTDFSGHVLSLCHLGQKGGRQFVAQLKAASSPMSARTDVPRASEAKGSSILLPDTAREHHGQGEDSGCSEYVSGVSSAADITTCRMSPGARFLGMVGPSSTTWVPIPRWISVRD